MNGAQVEARTSHPIPVLYAAGDIAGGSCCHNCASGTGLMGAPSSASSSAGVQWGLRKGAEEASGSTIQPALRGPRARTTASESASMTCNSVEAGPDGRRRPWSYCWTVSSVKPRRRANCAWVDPNLARSARTDGGRYTASVSPGSASVHTSRSSAACASIGSARFGIGIMAISGRHARSRSTRRWRTVLDYGGHGNEQTVSRFSELLRMEKPERSVYTPQDFFQWREAGSLELTPKFQRRGVWTAAARSFFVDTLLRQMPVPPIYIRIVQSEDRKRSVRQVIDGQQRISCILDYLDGKFRLSRTLPGSWAGKAFEGLTPSEQQQITTFLPNCSTAFPIRRCSRYSPGSTHIAFR